MVRTNRNVSEGEDLMRSLEHYGAFLCEYIGVPEEEIHVLYLGLIVTGIKRVKSYTTVHKAGRCDET